MKPQQLFKEWKLSQKVNMRVYTDEEMFVMGYEAREYEFITLCKKIEELSQKLKHFDTETKPNKTKVKKHE